MDQVLMDELWANAASRVSGLEIRNRLLEEELTQIKRDIKFWGKVKEFAKPDPCDACKGRGEIKTWDGGDSHFETCQACDGTGRRSPSKNKK